MNGTEKQNETSMEMPAEDSRVTMGNQTEKKHRFHLKMPQKGRKHSVKKRIAYTFIATMAATLLIIGLINYFFLGSFYIRDKEHILAESFQKLNATGGDSDDIPDTFEQFCVTNNLKVIITGPELSSFVYSNATDRQSLQTLIFGLISGNEQANTKVVDSKDNYQIQKFYDSHTVVVILAAALLLEGIHNGFYDGQTDTASTVLPGSRLIHFVEFYPDFLNIFLRDWMSGIKYTDTQFIF